MIQEIQLGTNKENGSYMNITSHARPPYILHHMSRTKTTTIAVRKQDRHFDIDIHQL